MSPILIVGKDGLPLNYPRPVRDPWEWMRVGKTSERFDCWNSQLFIFVGRFNSLSMRKTRDCQLGIHWTYLMPRSHVTGCLYKRCLLLALRDRINDDHQPATGKNTSIPCGESAFLMRGMLVSVC